MDYRYTGVDTLDEPITTTMVFLPPFFSRDVALTRRRCFVQARDLLSIYTKLVQVLYPRRKGDARQVLRSAPLPPPRWLKQVETEVLIGSKREWDLWGPLILCLGLGIMLSINVSPYVYTCTRPHPPHPQAPPNQSLSIFSSVIVLVCLGSVVVTLQAQLLGGRVSFLQALCVLGG